MKKLFLALMLVFASAFAFAANQTSTYNFCTTNVNDQVTEEPMSVTITIYVHPETRYDMCDVKLIDQYGGVQLDIKCKVETGIVREKVYPTLTMKEMSRDIPTNRKWELKFLGDRARLYCVGGASYVFKYDPTIVTAAPATTTTEEEAAPTEEEDLNEEE